MIEMYSCPEHGTENVLVHRKHGELAAICLVCFNVFAREKPDDPQSGDLLQRNEFYQAISDFEVAVLVNYITQRNPETKISNSDAQKELDRARHELTKYVKAHLTFHDDPRVRVIETEDLAWLLAHADAESPIVYPAKAEELANWKRIKALYTPDVT